MKRWNFFIFSLIKIYRLSESLIELIEFGATKFDKALRQHF